jgi:NADH-quinone oxidoreductase subunit J
MDIPAIPFYLFAGMAIACALLVVLKKNPVSSAFALVMVFFSFAGIYGLLQAHLIATLQVLVYAGAIMVLFVFVIMLLNADVPSFDLKRVSMGARAGIGVLVLTLLGFFVWVFKNTVLTSPQGKYSTAAIDAAGGNTKVISQVMFSEYILPFELTSILLLAAIVGTVAIAMRRSHGGDHAS